MDPVTDAILGVLPSLASETITDAVKSAYEALKAVIRHRWGDGAPISKAITAVEEDPQSKGQAAVLEEKVVAVKAAEDPDVLQALHLLVERMKAHGIGGDNVAKIQFIMNGGVVQGVAGAASVTIGSMNFGAPPKR